MDPLYGSAGGGESGNCPIFLSHLLAHHPLGVAGLQRRALRTGVAEGARSIDRHLPAGLAPFWSGAGHVDITHACPGIVIEII